LLPATANQVLEESGARTAAYVIRNRIPAPIRTLLRILPPRPAARLLLATIARHSWTFASAAACSYQLRPTPTVRLAGDPATGAMPGVAVDPYLATAITPMMYQAQETLRIAREERPNAKRILDGVHKKFTALCEEFVARNLPVHWGINTRVTDIMRDEAMLPLWRKAGLIHISLGTEAAAQMNLDRFRKQTTIEQNKRAIKLIQSHGMVAEAQFIMGMENETPETIEETYRLSQDWKPDMANWNMYTPWPFAELFEELGDKVEVRDYAKYNFVTPIMKPDAMDREDVLKGVLRNYARFYMRKAFFEYLFIRDPFKRKYMLGCLKAFMKTTVTKRFYDIGRVHMQGGQLEVDLGFDESRVYTREQIAERKASRPDFSADVTFGGAIPAGIDPEEVKHQEENLLNIPLRYSGGHNHCAPVGRAASRIST
jgi:hypothetical protein